MTVNRWIELTEFEPARIGPDRLSMETGHRLHRLFGRYVDVEFPSPKTEGNWQLTSRGWVGFIPVRRDLGLRILPRIPVDNLFLMLEYAYRLKSFRILDGLAGTGSLQGFVDRLVNLLAFWILKRCRKGLYQAYEQESGDLPAVRGRLNVGRMARKPLSVRFSCDYRRLTPDCGDNRILLWTLYRVICGNPAVSDRTKAQVIRAYRSLKGLVSLTPCRPEDCTGRQYHSLNRDYALLHALCRIILDGEVPSHEPGTRTMFPFLIHMPRLYEMFVAEWLAAHAPEDCLFRAQERVEIGTAGMIRFKIDLVAVDRYGGRPRCVMDTKYRTEPPSSQEIAQVVTYALAKGCREAVLVVPVGEAGGLDEMIGGIRVRSMAFDITGDPEEGGRRFLREWLGKNAAC
jgi:5-methylcytosine-specific restriction enzyme subunit McrC